VGALVRQILGRRVGGASGKDGFDPAALALLFAADWLDHVAVEIELRLAEGWDVISDRFTLSSLAYQALTCGDAEWVAAVNGRAPAPDVTFYLEVAPSTAIRRRFAASADRELFEVPAFQRRVARSYREALARLVAQGQRVEIVDGERPVAEVTAEPSGGPVGALVRQILGRRVGGASGKDGFDPAALALLFAADRLDHVAVEIEPRLADGCDVISDRFTLSSLAYQSLTCGDAPWVAAVNSRALAPDAILFLEVNPATATRRRLAASARPEIFEVLAFQRKVARAYREALERLRRAGQRIEVVDGERPVGEVTAALAARAAAILG